MTNPQLLAVADALGWTLVHSLWQIALVALLLKGTLMLCSNQSARLRYGLSLASMLVIALATVLTFVWNYHPIVPTMAMGDVVDLETTSIPFLEITDTNFEASLWEIWLTRLEYALPYLAMAWLIGIFVTSIGTIQGYFQLQRLQMRHSQAVSEAWQIRLEALQTRMGIQRKVQLLSTSLLSEPITFRHFKPVILLPASLLTGLTTAQIEVLLLHELAHIRRYDYLINWVQSCLEVLFFYHPAFWWISRQVRAEREHCCDDLVMRVVQQPMLYAQTLTQLQLNFHSLKTNLAMSATKDQGVFTTRIHRLFGKYSIPNRPRRGAILALLLAISVVAWAFYEPASLDIQQTQIEQKRDTIPNKVEPKIEESFRLVDKDGNSVDLEALSEEERIQMLESGEYNLVACSPTEDETELFKLFDKMFEVGNDEVDDVQFHEDAVLNEDGNWELHVKHLERDTIPIISIEPVSKTGYYIKLNTGDIKVLYPRYVVDGVLIDADIDAVIQSEEIASISLMTISESIERYGDVGKNGVAEIVSLEYEKQNQTTFKADKVTLPTSIPMSDFIAESKDEQMLLVADGVIWGKLGNNPASDAKLRELHEQYIETIDVRGGDKAIELYGEQGANGVVEVNTKVGKQLKGKTTGVNILSGDGMKMSKIRLRPSIADPDKEPLYVIDGEIVDRKKFKNIDPNQIDRMEVLKGEKAIAIYGEQARNGIVEIFTKKLKQETIESLKKAQKSAAPHFKFEPLTEGSKLFKFEPLEEGSDLEPLLVINGEIIEDDRHLDPRWIKKVEVLKGKKATDKYGERGRYGVIEVTWKSWNEFKKEHPPKGMVLNGAIYDNMDTEEESLRRLLPRDPERYHRRTFLEPDEAVKKYGDAGKGGIWELHSDESVVNIEYPKVGLAPDKVALEGDPLLVVNDEIIDCPEGVSAYIGKNIKSRQIKKINIWKGKDALQRYGEQGKAGVIEIFTKKASKRKARLEVQVMPEVEKVRFVLDFNSHSSGTWRVYDPKGKRVELADEFLRDGNTDNGAMYFDWDTKGKMRGIYTTTLEANGKTIEKQFKLDINTPAIDKKVVLDAALEQIGDDAIIRAWNSLAVSPNPASDIVNVEINIAKSSKVELSIFDMQGKEVKRFHGSSFSAKQFQGHAALKWEIGNSPSGNYIAVLVVDGKRLTKQFVVQ